MREFRDRRDANRIDRMQAQSTPATAIGERLQHARQRAGLSIADLSARTKIRATLLEAIEHGDFGRLPPGLLTRGFLRAYAREVGLDPDAVVRQFQAEFAPDAPDAPGGTVVMAVSAPLSAPQRPSRPPAVTAVVTGVLAAVLFFAFSSWLRTSEPMRQASPPTIGTTGAADAAVAEAGDTAPAASVDAVTAASVEPRDRAVSVEIAAAGPVWIEATADGTPLLYRLLQRGERAAIAVYHDLNLKVGDAGAFEYTINGVPGIPLGPPAAVRVLHITSENYTTFQLPAAR
jgi:cytoskeletal protein RodZ